MENKAIKTTFQDKAIQVRYPTKEANEKEYCFHCGWHKSKHPGDCKFMSFEKARKKGLLGAKPEGLKMTKHTLGPWKAHIRQDGYSINGVDCLLVTAKRDPVVLPECWEMHKANARLIATAPELLEACKEARKVLHMVEWCADKTLELVEEAIAKAENGEK